MYYTRLLFSSIFLLLVQFCHSQSESEVLPLSEIPEYKDDYGPGNIISRTIEGLGYRYYWATEGLKAEDLAYRPSEDAQDVMQTLTHLYGLSTTILNGAKNEANIRPSDWSQLTYQELRTGTLHNLNQASQTFNNMTADDIADLKIIFERNGTRNEIPFWNMLNGPIADALYHVGQIVSFRRTSGNPMNPKVNVFMGKNRD